MMIDLTEQVDIISIDTSIDGVSLFTKNLSIRIVKEFEYELAGDNKTFALILLGEELKDLQIRNIFWTIVNSLGAQTDGD